MQAGGFHPGNGTQTHRHPVRHWIRVLVAVLVSPVCHTAIGAPLEPVLVSSPHPELLTRFAELATNRGHQVTTVEANGQTSLEFLTADPERALTILLGQDSYLLVYAAGSGALIRAELLGSSKLDLPLSVLPSQDTPAIVPAGTPTALEPVQPAGDAAADSRRFELQSVPPEQAVDKLAHALGSRRESDRAWAVDGLGEFGLRGDQRAVLVLGQVLFSERSAAIRADVVNWLKSIGDDKAAHFVEAAGQDPSEAVRKAAGVE